MQDCNEKWREAIRACKERKFKNCLLVEQEDILEFMNSESYILAMELLELTGAKLGIGREEKTPFSYMFDSGGFYKYCPTAIPNKEYISPDETVSKEDTSLIEIPKGAICRMAKSFRFLHKDVSFTEFIYGKINKISEACPK